MTTPDGLPPLREVIAAHDLRARRSLGQNFLLDLNLTRRIARAGGPIDGKTIVEIGPGPGGLTRALLLEGAGRVIAIERDERCLPALEQIARRWPGQVQLVHADALAVNYASLTGPDACLVANLPYNIATPLLLGWLKTAPWPPWFSSLTCMFQREVAQRIVATPGSRHYGRLAVIAGWRTRAEIAFEVNPRAFTPPPRVTSAVVHLSPRLKPQPASVTTLEAVTAAAFGQRRKMLRSSLKKLWSQPEDQLQECGIPPTLRAEQLDIAGFCALARQLEHNRKDDNV